MTKEKYEIIEIDKRIDKLNHSLSALMPLYHQIDRKVKNIQVEVASLKDKRVALSEGQMSFDNLFDQTF